MIYGTHGDPTLAITTIDALAKNNYLFTGNSVDKSVGAPFGTDVKYTDFMPFIVYLLAPLSLVIGAVASYNLIQFLSLPLAAFAMYLLARKFSLSRKASFLAGYIFSFYPFHLQHTVSTTLNKSQTWAIPLFVLALINFDKKKDAKNATALAAAAFATAFFSYYHFFFAVLFTAIFYIYKLLYKQPIAKKSEIKHFAIAGAVFFILFACLILPILQSAAEAGEASATSVFSSEHSTVLKAAIGSAPPEFFVIPPAQHPLLGSITMPLLNMPGWNIESTALYLGFSVLALAGYALLKVKNDDRVRFLLFSSVCVFVLATGLFLRYIDLFGLHIAAAPLVVAIYFQYTGRKKLAAGAVALGLLFALLPLFYPYLIPIAIAPGKLATGINFSEFSAMDVIEHLDKYHYFPIPMPSLATFYIAPFFRSYANFALWLILFIALIAAIGFDKAFSHSKNSRLMFAIVFLVLLFDYANVPPWRTTDLSQVPEEYGWLASQQGDFIVAEYPLDYYSLYSYYQLVHGKRLFNSQYSQQIVELGKQLWDIRKEETAEKLSELGVQFVILHDETLADRVPPNIITRAMFESWYRGKRVDAVQEFLKNNLNGTKLLRPVARFSHATIFEVVKE